MCNNGTRWRWGCPSSCPSLRFFSNSNNCPMKLKLGAMMHRFVLTNLYASTMDICVFFMMYAMVMVAERDTPAWQWMRTFPFASATESINAKASLKYCDKFWWQLSVAGSLLYTRPSFPKWFGRCDVTLRMCVTPSSRKTSAFEESRSLPKMRNGKTVEAEAFSIQGST